MLAEQLRRVRQGGRTNLCKPLDRLLADPHISEDGLCGELPFGSASILMAIQAGLRDPASIADLLPQDPA
jgi:hypothetical protein